MASDDVRDRLIGDLSRRVAELERRGGGGPSEALTPNYLTIHPDGTIGAVFAGGLILHPQEGASPAAENEVQWLRASTGAQTAFIYSTFTPSGAGAQSFAQFAAEATPDLQAGAPTSLKIAASQVGGNAPGVKSAAVIAETESVVFPGAHAIAYVNIKAQAPGPDHSHNYVIADDQARSTFLQLLSTQKLRDASGTVTVTWPGGSATSNTITVGHGLGALPQSVTAIPNDTAGVGATMVTAFFNATSVSIQLTTTGFQPPNTATTPVSWRAVG